MRYTNITTQEVQLHQGQKELGLAEGQHWQKKALHPLPQSHGAVAQPALAHSTQTVSRCGQGTAREFPWKSLVLSWQGNEAAPAIMTPTQRTTFSW